MSTTVVAEPTWSFSRAATLMGCRRETVADLARRRGLALPGTTRLGRRGLLELARLLNVDLDIAGSAVGRTP